MREMFSFQIDALRRALTAHIGSLGPTTGLPYVDVHTVLDGEVITWDSVTGEVRSVPIKD
jgi:hypothetical protein